MSFSFRDKPRLSDRLRGKSGDELINELKNQIDQERKMFFDSAPNWGSAHSSGPFTSRTGFPFEDDMMPRAGRQDIRSHLDDLAQRHPEFADQLRCPPWAGEMSSSPSHTGSWGRNRRGSNEGEGLSSSSSVGSNEAGATSPKAEESRGRNPIPQHGLRNTVDLGQKQDEAGNDDAGSRGQRSMSAPPDARNQQTPDTTKQSQQPQQPQRFVSRVNITPGKPPVAPQKPQSPQQPASNVRHIPIFVEGRDEPILPKNVSEEPPVEQVFSQRIPPQQQPTFSKPQTFTSHHQFQPQNRFYSTPQQTRAEHGRPQQNVPQPKAETVFAQQVPVQNAQQNASMQQPKEIPKPQQQQHKPPQPNDPISRVQAVQKDVENLQRMVENFSGTSRKDKQYIYLDEMLTRNLLKLDDIDTEGKENVRQARKDVIRNIQKCISILESKVPVTEEQNEMAISEQSEEVQSIETERGDETKAERMEAEAGQQEAEAIQPEKMEADVIESQEAAVGAGEEKIDLTEQQPKEHVEKMDAEPLEDKLSEEKKLESEDTRAAPVPDGDVVKKTASGQQLSNEMTVDSEAPVTATEEASPGNAVKEESTDMEVELVQSPSSEQTEVVAETSGNEKATLTSDTGPQDVDVAKDSKIPNQEQKELSDGTATNLGAAGETVTTETSEQNDRETEDKTAMQVEPLSSSSEIKDPPKTEESCAVIAEAGKQTISDQEPKQEAESKKKRTGKKLKSPSKKPTKQPSNVKSDSVANAEAQS